VKGAQSSLVAVASIILGVMLVVIIVGGVVIILPSLYSISRRRDDLLVRFLGLPRPALQVRVTGTYRSMRTTILSSCPNPLSA
jgi:hypothetical protein